MGPRLTPYRRFSLLTSTPTHPLRSSDKDHKALSRGIYRYIYICTHIYTYIRCIYTTLMTLIVILLTSICAFCGVLVYQMITGISTENCSTHGLIHTGLERRMGNPRLRPESKMHCHTNAMFPAVYTTQLLQPLLEPRHVCSKPISSPKNPK